MRNRTSRLAATARVQGEESSVSNRTLITAALVGLLVAGASSGALAQAPQGEPASQGGWRVNIAPYLWLPTLNNTLDYNLPPALDGRLPTALSTTPGQYLGGLNFAASFAAEAQYKRFSVLTDYLYMNFDTGASHIKEVDFAGRPAEVIPRSLQTSISTHMKSTIWTLAGGYTVAEGSWGNFDVIAGFRYLGVYAGTSYDLALTLTGPRGNGATFGGSGAVTGTDGIWNGIAGLHGRLLLGKTGLFIPYYFDIGAGGSNLTWQIASGLGYQNGWAGVSLTYRYLSFKQPSSFIVQHLTMGGPMVMVNLSF